jgi:hypothetical protein
MCINSSLGFRPPGELPPSLERVIRLFFDSLDSTFAEATGLENRANCRRSNRLGEKQIELIGIVFWALPAIFRPVSWL